MLKARTGDRFVFGLSARNIELLQQGRPIHIDLRELGADRGNILIFYGKTEETMKQALLDAGVELPGEKQ
jgi:hypothetical protein